MDITPIEVEIYATETGRRPFEEWLEALPKQVRLRVEQRLHRLRLGLIGDSKYLRNGLFELRLHAGPGYRIYYGMIGKKLIILLEAGDKGSQAADILAAKGYWDDYLRRREP